MSDEKRAIEETHRKVIEKLRDDLAEARSVCSLAWQRFCAERVWAFDPMQDPVATLKHHLTEGSFFFAPPRLPAEAEVEHRKQCPREFGHEGFCATRSG